MTVNLRNTSGEPLHLGREGRLIAPDEVVKVDGDLAPKDQQVDDAYVVTTAGGLVAFPMSTWTAAGGTNKTQPAAPAAAPEEIK